MNWTQLAVPFHEEPTNLRIEHKQEALKTGRHQLIAYDGNEPVYFQFYDWNVWYGHCYGRLLINDFVREANARARSTTPDPADNPPAEAGT